MSSMSIWNAWTGRVVRRTGFTLSSCHYFYADLRCDCVPCFWSVQFNVNITKFDMAFPVLMFFFLSKGSSSVVWGWYCYELGARNPACFKIKMPQMWNPWSSPGLLLRALQQEFSCSMCGSNIWLPMGCCKLLSVYLVDPLVVLFTTYRCSNENDWYAITSLLQSCKQPLTSIISSSNGRWIYALKSPYLCLEIDSRGGGT
jgi:hypothetical protein